MKNRESELFIMSWMYVMNGVKAPRPRQAFMAFSLCDILGPVWEKKVEKRSGDWHAILHISNVVDGKGTKKDQSNQYPFWEHIVAVMK